MKVDFHLSTDDNLQHILEEICRLQFANKTHKLHYITHISPDSQYATLSPLHTVKMHTNIVNFKINGENKMWSESQIKVVARAESLGKSCTMTLKKQP